MDVVGIIALSMGAAWASGINLYAAVFVLGWLGSSGNLVLPEGLQICAEPTVMAVAGFMFVVEFFADKIPGLDTLWDAIHTFIRIPAGAILAAGAVGELGQGAELTALLLGGTLATTTHLTKAGTRLLINASPEPVSNWVASTSEDVAVVTGVWAAFNHPLLFLLALLIMIVLMLWLLPKIWGGIRLLFTRITSLFESGGTPARREGARPLLPQPEHDDQ